MTSITSDAHLSEADASVPPEVNRLAHLVNPQEDNNLLAEAVVIADDNPAPQPEVTAVIAVITINDSLPSELSIEQDLTPAQEELRALLTPANGRFVNILNIDQRPEYRRPDLKEMMPDIGRVINSIAHQFTDQSCPHLHFDELVSQGYEKLAKLIDKGVLERLPNRQEFFRFFKTTINNHVKGQVHKYRFTMKRTGVRPPPRGEVNFESTKPVEISLDDPEANLQVGEEQVNQYADLKDTELYHHLINFMSPIEKFVFDQLLSPNALAWSYAELDGHRGRKVGSVKDAGIKAIHLALGLGLPLDYFEETLARVKEIVEKHTDPQSETDEEARYNHSIKLLEEVFHVQIPRSLDKMLARRLLTIAARVNHTKVTDDVKQHLEEVGAKAPPPLHGNVLPCFGQLYQKNNRICSSCGIQASCRAEAMNLGLGDITIHPKLLGAKSTRIPALIPRSMMPAEPSSEATETVIEDGNEQPTQIVPTSQRDEEILNYLQGHFRSTKYNNELYFKHKDKLAKPRFIFWIGPRPNGPLLLRFCKPSPSLKEKTQTIKNGSYLPDNCTPDEAIALIDQHAQETFL